MERDEVLELLQKIEGTYPRFKSNKHTDEAWAEALANTPALRVWDAWKRWVLENDEYPTAPAALIRRAKDQAQPEGVLSPESREGIDRYYAAQGLTKIFFTNSNGLQCSQWVRGAR